MHGSVRFGVCRQPDSGLAALDEVVVRLAAGVDGRNVLPELDEVLVLVHPVVEEGEFVDDVGLAGGDEVSGHGSAQHAHGAFEGDDGPVDFLMGGVRGERHP